MICSIAIVFWFYVVTPTMKKAMKRLKYDQILIVNFLSFAETCANHENDCSSR